MSKKQPDSIKEYIISINDLRDYNEWEQRSFEEGSWQIKIVVRRPERELIFNDFFPRIFELNMSAMIGKFDLRF